MDAETAKWLVGTAIALLTAVLTYLQYLEMRRRKRDAGADSLHRRRPNAMTRFLFGHAAPRYAPLDSNLSDHLWTALIEQMRPIDSGLQDNRLDELMDRSQQYLNHIYPSLHGGNDDLLFRVAAGAKTFEQFVSSQRQAFPGSTFRSLDFTVSEPPSLENLDRLMVRRQPHSEEHPPQDEQLNAIAFWLLCHHGLGRLRPSESDQLRKQMTKQAQQANREIRKLLGFN